MASKDTYELEKYINNLYDKLKPFAEKEKIFKPIEVYFAETTPRGYPGDFCYSDRKNYYLGNIGDRGLLTIEKTNSLFEVSYWIFKHQTSTMAFDYERKHRIKGRDSRRIAFEKQIELMGFIGCEYKQRAESEINEILKEHPFQDKLFK